MRILRRSLLAILALLLIAAGWLYLRITDHPDLSAFDRYRLEPSAAADGPRVTVTFLGVSTLLIDDGTTALLTDGFFTRPSKAATLFGRIAPDPALIAAALERARIARLAAVIAVHSHYDHAMDSPEVARRTGALLIGSESTANIARGWQLPADQFRLATPGAAVPFGAFRVTLLESPHFPHGMAMGEIAEPLVPPVRADAYREGGSYSVLVEHPLGTLLVQGSAGWRDGALAGRRADVVLLGIGGMGGSDDPYRDTYWREVVDAVGARCVMPIHFDDFTLPLADPPPAMPMLLDDVPASLDFLVRRAAERGIGFGILPAGQPLPLLGAGAAPCRPPS
jgi:L-ascorbate metabolism protein UlaG (beta-lactamase superfamily)